jgi:hypothetical protein
VTSARKLGRFAALVFASADYLIHLRLCRSRRPPTNRSCSDEKSNTAPDPACHHDLHVLVRFASSANLQIRIAKLHSFHHHTVLRANQASKIVSVNRDGRDHVMITRSQSSASPSPSQFEAGHPLKA